MLKSFSITKILLITVFSTSVYAADCDVLAVAKCICAAPMLVECGNITGSITADARLKSINITITNENGIQRQVTLQNPPGGAREYSFADSNEWIRDNINGLRPGDRLSISPNGFNLQDDTPVYERSDALNQVGTAGKASSPSSGKASSPSSGERCFYTDEPLIVEYSACSQKVCSVKVKCRFDDGTQYEGNALCPSLRDGHCPSATDCMLDEEITFSTPNNLSEIEIKDSATDTVISQ